MGQFLLEKWGLAEKFNHLQMDVGGRNRLIKPVFCGDCYGISNLLSAAWGSRRSTLVTPSQFSAFVLNTIYGHLRRRRLAAFLNCCAADLEDLADFPGEARLTIDHLVDRGR